MFAVGLGFSPSEATTVATAISELAGKILVHATRGEITLSAMSHGVPPALTVTARGEGEGVADVQRAIRDRYSRWGRLRNSLAGVERLIDRVEIVSEVGKGTVATAGKSHDGRSTAGTEARLSSLCLRLQRGCGVRGWGRDGLGTGARGRGARAPRALMLTILARRLTSPSGGAIVARELGKGENTLGAIG